LTKSIEQLKVAFIDKTILDMRSW